MLVSGKAQKHSTPYVSKRKLEAFQETPLKRKIDFRELQTQCNQDEKPADDDETVCSLQPAAFFTSVENGGTPEEQFILCMQQFGGEPDNAGEGCLKWGELIRCVRDDVDVANRNTAK